MGGGRDHVVTNGMYISPRLSPVEPLRLYLLHFLVIDVLSLPLTRFHDESEEPKHPLRDSHSRGSLPRY